LTPYRKGDFVWCLLPFREQPATPGPVAHIVYVHRTLRDQAAQTFAHVIYTTTSAAEARRRGSILVVEPQARNLGMRRPFVIVTRRQAILPYLAAFFHRANQPDRGVVGRAPRDLIQRIAVELARAAHPDDADVNVVASPRRPRTTT
jgi:hypothetical protein